MLVTSKGKTESTQELVNASIQVLIDALESGHSEVLASYLKAMAKFHHYSFGNTLLIATHKTVATILELAAPLQAGFHIRIENEPWMRLVIEDTQERGPNGLPAISVAHYGEQNGDLMRDPGMIFEAEESGKEMNLIPFYWRNDSVGVEQYSAFTEDGRTLLNAKLKREHFAFARTWDANLRAQGFLEAFVSQQKGDT